MSKEEYITCSESLLMMWMLNIIKDSEYNSIMDRLNERGAYEVRLAGGEENG